MERKEYLKIRPSASVAILFIHGIVGTPNHFNPFVSLVPNTVSVYNLLLDGHGKGVKDFSRTSMKKWEEQVEKAITQLSETHQKIYIVAHSMGTLFAVDQALKCEKVAKLFLLAVPLKIFLKPQMFTNSMKVYFNKIQPTDKVALAAKKCYGVEQDKNPFSYIGWIPRFLELFTKARNIRKSMCLLKTPCTVYQSEKDEMVSLRSVKYLRDNPGISVVQLKNSGHYYYDENDFDFLLKEFEKFVS